jgi:hypothetical protein
MRFNAVRIIAKWSLSVVNHPPMSSSVDTALHAFANTFGSLMNGSSVFVMTSYALTCVASLVGLVRPVALVDVRPLGVRSNPVEHFSVQALDVQDRSQLEAGVVVVCVVVEADLLLSKVHPQHVIRSINRLVDEVRHDKDVGVCVVDTNVVSSTYGVPHTSEATLANLAD